MWKRLSSLRSWHACVFTVRNENFQEKKNVPPRGVLNVSPKGSSSLDWIRACADDTK